MPSKSGGPLGSEKRGVRLEPLMEAIIGGKKNNKLRREMLNPFDTEGSTSFAILVQIFFGSPLENENQNSGEAEVVVNTHFFLTPSVLAQDAS